MKITEELSNKRRFHRAKTYRKKIKIQIEKTGLPRFMEKWNKFTGPDLINLTDKLTVNDWKEILEIRKKAKVLFLLNRIDFLNDLVSNTAAYVEGSRKFDIAPFKSLFCDLMNEHHDVCLKYVAEHEMQFVKNFNERLLELNDSDFTFSMLPSEMKDRLPVISNYLSSSIKYFERKKAYSEPVTHQVTQESQSKSTVLKKQKPTCFKQLFEDEYQDNYMDFVDILMDFGAKNPLINKSYAWIGNKSMARLYYQLMTEKGVFKKVSADLAGQLFESFFKNINKHTIKDPDLSDSSFKVYNPILNLAIDSTIKNIEITKKFDKINN